MNHTFSWQIFSMLTQDQQQLQKVVQTVRWRRCLLKDSVVYSVNGSTELDPADPTTFVPWSQLTETQVIQWLEQRLPAEQVQQLDQQLIKMVDPAAALGENEYFPPWAQA